VKKCKKFFAKTCEKSAGKVLKSHGMMSIYIALQQLKLNRISVSGFFMSFLTVHHAYMFLCYKPWLA
jgi:hypothetical protein